MLILLVIVILLSVFYSNVYNDYDAECGVSPKVKYYKDLLYYVMQDRVYTGDAPQRGDWPWLVSIHVYGINSSLCTGSIVSRKWVLTAAHCLAAEGNYAVAVSYGSVELNEITNDVIYADSYVIHPLYDKQSHINDIALIKLRSSMRFGKNVHSLCLGQNIQPENYEVAFAVGFGQKFVGTNETVRVDYAREAMLDIWIDSDGYYYNCKPNSTTVCTVGYNQGTTKGDSGGSLMVIRGDRFYSVGVVSTGSRMRHRKSKTTFEVNSYYAKTAVYCDWISKTTSSEVKCDNQTFTL